MSMPPTQIEFRATSVEYMPNRLAIHCWTDETQLGLSPELAPPTTKSGHPSASKIRPILFIGTSISVDEEKA